MAKEYALSTGRILRKLWCTKGVKSTDTGAPVFFIGGRENSGYKPVSDWLNENMYIGPPIF